MSAIQSNVSLVKTVIRKFTHQVNGARGRRFAKNRLPITGNGTPYRLITTAIQHDLLQKTRVPFFDRPFDPTLNPHGALLTDVIVEDGIRTHRCLANDLKRLLYPLLVE